MRILVVGAGGAGGYFGGRWCEAGHEVTVLARGAHLRAIKERGLEIRSPAGPATARVRAVKDPAEVGPVDLAVFATKSWQLDGAAAQVAPHLSPETVVFGLQNGVESPQILARHIDPDRVLTAICRIISYIEEPGVILHVGAEPTVVFGERSGGTSERVASLAAALDLGPALRAVGSAEAEVELWKKFVFFAPLSGVGSIVRAPFGPIREVPESRRLLRTAVEEVWTVGRARGVALSDDLVTGTLSFIDTLPAEGTSSMQRDFAGGARTELDALAGAVVRLGKEVGIPTPVHEVIHAALLPSELRARGDLAW